MKCFTMLLIQQSYEVNTHFIIKRKKKRQFREIKEYPFEHTARRLGSSDAVIDATHHSFNYQILIECVRVLGTDRDVGEEQ